MGHGVVGIIDDTIEVFFALAVRFLVAIGLAVVPASWKEKWEHFAWRNAVLFGISFIFIPMLFWVLRCPGGVPVPGYDPRCSFTGVILDALYPGLMAFALNYMGEGVFRWARDKRASDSGKRGALLINRVGFWLFLITVVVEYVLLRLALVWHISLAVSIIASIAISLFGLLLQLPSARVIGAGIRTLVSEVLWWVILVVKLIVHLLPIPFWLKPIISIALTIGLFVVVNLLLAIFRRDHPASA